MAVRSDAGAAFMDRWSQRYYEGYLAETMRGDLIAARAAYEEVIAATGAGAPEIAARAALRLADIEALAGRRREAVELVARASVLGRDNVEIVEHADRIQARLASVPSQGSEVRGPPMGTVLTDVPDDVIAAFASAETALRTYHRIRLQPRLEALRTSVRAKESAMEKAVRAYLSVVDLGSADATVAAEFRAGSLYHDLAVALMFDLPPELEAQVAAKLRRSHRARAIKYLGRARAAYRRSLEAGESAEPMSKSERWLVPAAAGLRSVEDLLGGQ